MKVFAVILTLATVLGCAATAPEAATIGLINADFEDARTVLNVSDPIRGDWIGNAVVGWTVFNGAGVFESNVPGPAYEALHKGPRLGWSNGGSLSQVTDVTFDVGRTYTVTADIGWRFHTAAFPGGQISMFADPPTTLVGSAPLKAPTQGGFAQATLLLDSSMGNPHFGRRIGVVSSAKGTQVNFDSGVLAQTPLPAGVWLFLSALALMMGLRRYQNA